MHRLVATLTALAFSGAAFASPPSLFRHVDNPTPVPANSRTALANPGKPVSQSVAVTLNRTAIADAVKEGGMWIDLPGGKRVFAKSDRQEKLGDGNVSWYGKVSLMKGERPVVVTQGPDAVFGTLVADDGTTLQLETLRGVTRLTTLDPRFDMQAHPQPGTPSDAMPVTLPAPGVEDTLRTKQALATAATGVPARVDVLVGYIPELVTRYGTTAAAITRINYLVSVMNQALQDSQVTGRVHLVGTMQVNYTATDTNSHALGLLSNVNGDPGLQPLRDARKRLGADLTVLLRPFLRPESDSCGNGYEPGGPNSYTTAAAKSGYSAVSDGKDDDSGYYCTITTFAHELGHNMGLSHDAANSSSPGAYDYGYGWRQTFADNTGFYTLMAYSTGNQQLAPYYSNPRISYCLNTPCGDAATADQARALEQIMPVVAAFNQSIDPNMDLTGDSSADILYQKDGGITSLPFSNGSPDGASTQVMMPGYRIVAQGDLNGDHRTDLIWTSASNDLYAWTNQVSGIFAQTQLPNIPLGYSLVGTADIDGNGTADLLFINKGTNKFTYWLMNGTSVVSTTTVDARPGYYIAAIGDFDGDRRIDLMWTSAAHDLDFWSNNGNGTFTVSGSLPYPAGSTIVGSGDVDNDGRTDLVLADASTGQVQLWSMDGAVRSGLQQLTLPTGTRIATVDRFSGAVASLLLTNDARQLFLMNNDGSGNFTTSGALLAYPASSAGSYYRTYPVGYSVVSATPRQP